MIDPAEKKRREDAVNFARASVGLEGFTVSPEMDEIATRFINGEMDFKEYMVASIATLESV